jgi:DNA-binding transcriptional ArsR family regulator
MSMQEANDQVRPAEFVIQDVDTLKVLADPVRLRIHFELEQPRTVKELAAALDMPQTRLYYHVKLLERAGLITVVSRRTVSGIEERTYRTAATSTLVSPALGAELAETGAVAALLQMAAAQLEIAFQDSEHPIGHPESSVIGLNMGAVKLRPDQVEEFQTKIFGVLAEYVDSDDPAARKYDVLMAAWRRDAP